MNATDFKYSIVVVDWMDLRLDIPGDGRPTTGDLDPVTAAQVFWDSIIPIGLGTMGPVFESSFNGVTNVTINRDGTVTFSGGYEPDDAARTFWDTVAATMPASTHASA